MAADHPTLFDMPPDWAGVRGGSTRSYEEGAARITEHRDEDVNRVKRAIIRHAQVNGAVHADDVAHIDVSERNVVGIAFRVLAEAGYIVSTGEHRRSGLVAAHGRKSYVYRLTAKGLRLP